MMLLAFEDIAEQVAADEIANGLAIGDCFLEQRNGLFFDGKVSLQDFLDRFANADGVDWQAELLCSGYQNPAARTAVQLGHDHAGHEGGAAEDLFLGQGVAAHRRVQHQQGVVRRLGIDLLQHPDDLEQFVHQGGLVLKPAGGVDQDDVEPFRLRLGIGVEGEAGGGWRMYTRARYAPYVERLLLDGARSKLTRAALETLAVVAYRQPVTRARVSAVRGVNVDAVMRTLLARGLITEAGTDSDSGAVAFATTELFLERLGLSSLADLPDIAPLLPDVDVIDDLSENLNDEPRFAKLGGAAAVPEPPAGIDVDKD